MVQILVLFFLLLSSFTICETHISRPLAPQNRRPLEEKKPSSRGTDIRIKIGANEVSSCQATPVAKKQLNLKLCRMGYSTAAHCLDGDLQSIEFDGIGDINRKLLNVVIPEEYKNAMRTQMIESSKPQPQATQSVPDLEIVPVANEGASKATVGRAPVSADSALVVFDIECDKVEEVIPVPLAPVESDGRTAISIDVYLQKRRTPVAGNRGEGAQISAELILIKQNDFVFKVPSPQGYAIVGGDSGGPIFNKNGQLICPIAGSSYEFKRQTGRISLRPDGSNTSPLDPFTVQCDNRAISRLKEQLKQFDLLG